MSSAHAAAFALLASEGLGQGDVQGGRGLPQPVGLGREVAAGLGRVGRRRRGPGHDDRHRLGVVHPEQVAQRGEGQGPPVDATGQEGLEEGQVVADALLGRAPLDAPLGDCRLGGQRFRHPREPDPAEARGDLDLGVGTGQQPAEQLEDEALVVDQRRVRLLDADGPHPLRALVAAGDPPEQVEGEVRVEDGVVGDGPLAVDLDRADGGVVVAPQEVELVPVVAQTEEHLVAVPVGVHQETDQQGPVVAEHLGVDDLDRRRLLDAGVPALLGHVPAEVVDRDRRHGPAHWSTSSNQ